MRARLENPPVMDKVDPVAPLDTTQTMRDGDGRPSLGGAV